MKKLFSSLCTFAIICLLAFSGCSDGWTEVQSIIYFIKDGSGETLTSTIYRNTTDIESITKEEFNNAPSEYTESLLGYGWNPSLEVPINREETLKKVKNTVGKTIYIAIYSLYDPQIQKFNKVEVKSYELRYVKIRFKNKRIEINYYNTSDDLGFTTINVLPVSYKITYFED